MGKPLKHSDNDENNRRFRNLFEHIAIGLVICNTEGLFINVNEPFCKLTGYSQVELLKMSFVDITHPDDLSLDLIQVQQAFDGKIDNYSIEKRYIRKDKSIIWVNLTVSLIKDKKKAPHLFFGTVEDISLRKQSEKKLLQTQKDWKYIFQAITHPTTLLDKNHNIIDVNDSVIKFSGKTREELIGTSCYQVFHSKNKDCPPSGCPLDALLKSGKPETFEMEMETFNGTFLVSCTPLMDDMGELKNIVHIATDITYLKQIEQALQESETRYRILLDTAPVGIAIHSEGKIVFTNQTGSQLLKANSPEQIIGKSITEIIHPSTLPSSINRIQRLMAGETGLYPADDKYICFDGTIKDVQVYSTLINYKGKPATQVIVIDNTEQKKYIKRFQLTQFGIDHAQIGIYQIDEDGNIYYANEYACKSHGYTFDEITKLKSIDIDTSLNYAQWKSFRKNVRAKGSGTIETFHKRKDGSVYPVEVSVNFFEFQGEIVSFSFAKNITDRKRAEEEIIKKNVEYKALNEEYLVLNEELSENLERLQDMNTKLEEAKEKAEESDHLKTAFLQNMSHEIRTPLNAIMGFSDLLPEYFNDKDKLKKFTSIIKQRGADLLELVTDILDIAKIESGQLPVNSEECDLNLLFSEIETFFTEYRVRIKKTDVELKFNLHYQISNKLVIIDSGKLKQILVNLISNAFKFTHVGSVEIGCNLNKNNCLSFYVKDTGIGIPKEKQSVIFERFMQASTDTSKLYGGTGLGLSIIKGLLNLVGGEIWLDSEPDKGSTFNFTFPYKLSENEIIVTTLEFPKNSLPNKKFIILIVEDDLFNAEYLKEILSNTNYTILHAEYGKAAVEIATTQHINLILMDIRLPDMTGYEATRIIKQQKPNILIIAQTAYATSSDNQKAMEAGCDGYISKPISKDKLFELFDQLNNK